MRPAVFASGLATNVDRRAPRRLLFNAGAQLDFRFSLLAVLDMTLSLGAAAAFEEGAAPRREGMVSLKVLR